MEREQENEMLLSKLLQQPIPTLCYGRPMEYSSRVSAIPLTVNHQLNHTITVSFMRLTAPPQNLIMASEQAFPGSLLVRSLLYKDVPQENYTISVLLWWWLHMCPRHVAFEDIETIRKFPKLQEVTYSLIIEKVKSTQLFTCLPIFGQCFTDLTFLSYTVIQFAINSKETITPDAGH